MGSFDYTEFKRLNRAVRMPSPAQFAREGRRRTIGNNDPSGYQQGVHSPVTPNQTVNCLTGNISLGRAFVLEELKVKSDRDCQARYQIGPSNRTGAFTGENMAGKLFCSKDSPAIWPFPTGSMIIPQKTTYNAWTDRPDTTGVWAWGSMTGIDITCDFFWEAQWIVCVIGDSITWDIPSTNGTADAGGEHLWGARVVERMNDRGAIGGVRLINKGFGAADTRSAYLYMRDGYYDSPADLNVLSFGMNDCANQYISVSNYKANLLEIIKNCFRKNRNTEVIVCGPSSTDDPVRTPYIAAYRTAASEVATSAAALFPGSVRYVDLSTAYSTSSSDITSYFAEPAGVNHVHPNIAGQGLLGNVIGEKIAETQFYRRVGLAGAWS